MAADRTPGVERRDANTRSWNCATRSAPAYEFDWQQQLEREHPGRREPEDRRGSAPRSCAPPGHRRRAARPRSRLRAQPAVAAAGRRWPPRRRRARRCAAHRRDRIRTACHVGTAATTSAVTIDRSRTKPKTTPSTWASPARGISSGASARTNLSEPRRQQVPMTPPISANVRCSPITASASRPRVAPSEARTASSR